MLYMFQHTIRSSDLHLMYAVCIFARPTNAPLLKCLDINIE